MVAFKPAFFACVDAAEDCPHWVRSREVFSPADGVEGRPASSRRCFGPFATGRDADRFIEALQDAFELCRDPRCLRQSPDARRCAYGQIGRCLSPCDGTISMEQYRAEIRRSADYAAGRRGAFREHLAGQMKFLSSKLDFEQAGAVKQRLDRLAELDGPAFANVAPAEEFQWLAIQPGAGRQQAMGFAVDRGAVRTAKLEYPPKSGQLRKLLKTFRDSSPGRKNLPERRYVAGLVSQYLYGAESRRGLILRWRPDMKAEQLGETVRAAAEMLGLQEPSRRRKTGKSRKSGDVTDTGT
jgi:excinuclease UvrABC nuclease subunit